MEDGGYITGYAARLDPARLGRALQIFVMVSLIDQRQETLARFERAVGGIEDVLRCALIAGDDDYVLTLCVRDLDAYHDGELPGVASLRSLVTMRSVKDSKTLPV